MGRLSTTECTYLPTYPPSFYTFFSCLGFLQCKNNLKVQSTSATAQAKNVQSYVPYQFCFRSFQKCFAGTETTLRTRRNSQITFGTTSTSSSSNL